MSANVLATMSRPVEETVLLANGTAPSTSTTHSIKVNSATTDQATPSQTFATGGASPSASASRLSPKSKETKRVDRNKNRLREGSAVNDNGKPKDKERETRLPACEACKSRKVKCDALLPACTPCQKSGRECFGRDKIPNVSRGLVYDLQQKVKDLESRLALASSTSAAIEHVVAREHEGGNDSSSSGSHLTRPPAKRTRRGRSGRSSIDNAAQSPDSDAELSSSSVPSSPPGPMGPAPNAFIQQTSTILESLSSDLTDAARGRYRSSPNRSTTQSMENDEASALAALSRRNNDRARSPHRLKRRSSSNASRYRETAGPYLPSSSRFKDTTTPHSFKTRSRPGRPGTISAYDRTFFDRLIARYITYMNTALPIINEMRMWEMAGLVYQDDESSRLAAFSETSYGSMPPPPLPLSPGIDRITLSKHRYVVLMALAIALASLGRSHNFSPELRRLGHQYWAEAQTLYPVFFRFGDLDKLRATILQLQYALLIPSAGSVWELSGAAIRLVTELNLHVDRDFDSAANAPFTRESVDLRRRLFWTTYCLDRSLSVALARPPGLSDAWIHVQMPSLLSDVEILRLDREACAGDTTEEDPHKQIFRSHINLRRVQSEILCRLHSVNPRDYALDNDGVSHVQPGGGRASLALVMEVGPPTPNLEWQSRMMDKLVNWRSAYDQIQASPSVADRHPLSEGASSTANPFITRDWIDLNHNLTISLLFRPSPNNPRPDSHGLQQAFTASGRAMKIYKSMHRSSTLNFPWLATHHLFISGLTHLNALEKLTRTGVSCPSPVVEVVFNVQSCASTLEALTTRDDGYGTKIRDTFDAAASAVLRSVLEPGSVRPSSSTSPLDVPSVEDLVRGSPASSLNIRQQQTGQVASLLEASGNLRRASQHQEAAMQAAQPQQPTWLSDSTWNSLNALNAAPPPGSTIFVAAPPRIGRFGGSGRSLTPTLSERTTQNAASGVSTFPNGATYPPRGFGTQSSYTANLVPPGSAMMYGDLSDGNGNAFVVSPTSNVSHDPIFGGSTTSGSNGGATTQDRDLADRNAVPTFGFHNWLLQPYEGGADGLGHSGLSTANNAFGNSAANAFLFPNPSTASPSAYAGVEPFQSMYTMDTMQQTPSRSNGAGTYMAPSATIERHGSGETDASTLLDFLSMLPATNPGNGKSASSNNGSQPKA